MLPLPFVVAAALLLLFHCLRCHGLDISEDGPALRGVVGRKAGKLDGYFYSEALALASHTWDASWLRLWLTNPVLVIPGVEMDFHLDNSSDIDDVIAYLSTLSAETGKH